MAPIYREITLSWKGEEYTANPDYDMIQRIEGRGISIVGVIGRMYSGQPPVSHVAEIVAQLLRSGGARNVKAEDVYAHLMQAIASGDGQAEMERIGIAITTAFLPAGPSSGNSEGPGDGAKSEREAGVISSK